MIYIYIIYIYIVCVYCVCEHVGALTHETAIHINGRGLLAGVGFSSPTL